VEKAIELIAKRFPSERYPQVVFKPINKKIILRQRAPECIPIPSNVAQVKSFRIEIQKLIFCCCLKLGLPDGIPTDVLVTSVVSCNHIFIQQILHPSYSELTRLDNSMSVFYHHTEMTPLLPRPIQRRVFFFEIKEKDSLCLFSRCYMCSTHTSWLVSSIDYNL
jgi:A-kinase anchor protein 1